MADSERKECPNIDANEIDCPCGASDCERHGICCECIKYHRSQGGRPACVR